MGALSYMAAGFAEGAGRGMAGYGAEMTRQAGHDDLLRERQLNSMELEQLRQRDRMELQQDRLGARGGSGGKPTAVQQLSELGDLLLSGKATGPLMAGGMEPGRAADTASMAGGRAPMVDTPMPADRFTNPDRQDEAAAQPGMARTPKYTTGQAGEMMKEAYLTLRKAMGIVNPEASDNIAKAEQTEAVTEMGKKYVAGDVKQGAGALVLQGKKPFDDNGSGLDGSVPAGSVAASVVIKNKAAANNSNASAGQHSAAAQKTMAEINGELQKGATQERLSAMMTSLKDYAKDMDLSPEQKDDLNALRQKITKQMAGELDGRAAKRAGGGSSAGGTTKAEYDNLPSGAVYVGQDGKKYRKK